MLGLCAYIWHIAIPLVRKMLFLIFWDIEVAWLEVIDFILWAYSKTDGWDRNVAIECEIIDYIFHH